MRIDELKLEGFRNLENTNLCFSTKGNIIIGDNGQGKTNLLEAIYYLTILKSLRSNSDSECIRFGEKHFSLRGAWRDAEVGEEKISVAYDGKRKRVSISGKEIKKLSKAFGYFKSVILTPEDISIVRTGPSARRKYLDIVLSILSPVYLKNLKRYKLALESRNVLLRDEKKDDGIIYPWEKQMAAAGAFLTSRRKSFVSSVANYYEKLFIKLSSGERGDIRYRSSLLSDDEADITEELEVERIREVFEKKLEKYRTLERNRGITVNGPQTDEIEFRIGEKPIRNFGSQGQQRTAVICLKLAEAFLLKERHGILPVLLLDDVFAELDARRGSNLLEELVETHQSFITAPGKESFFDRLGHLPVWHIREGVISET